MRLEGKVAIVTGGARGLGGAAVAALCADGAAVIAADILAEAGKASVEKLREAGHRAEFAELDVRDPAAWQAVVDLTVARFGRIDCLVNNAGISISKTIETATLQDFQTIIEINLFGAFLGIKAALPVMQAGGGGSIVNISSNSTRMVVPLSSIYGASKAALANLTKTTAVHCAVSGYGIRCNSVHPGPHETDMLLGGAEHAADIPEIRRFIEAIPMGRMGKPSEVASVVTFLASDDSSYMTGAELFIDGGVTVT